MVVCIIAGCTKRTGRDKDVKFFRIPTIRAGRSDPKELELSIRRRQGYLAAISRYDLTNDALESSKIKICSRHFIFGKPAALFDETHPDWLPTFNLEHSTLDASTVLSITERYERKKARDSAGRNHGIEEQGPSSQTRDSSSEQDSNSDMDTNSAGDMDTNSEAVMDTMMDAMELTGDRPMLMLADAQVQTDQETVGLREALNNALQEIHALKQEVNYLTPFTEVSMKDKSNGFIQHYTGLPNFNVLKTVYEFVTPSKHNGKLTAFQEYIATLTKLRLNLSIQDLAYRFNVSNATISRILLKWLTIMDVRLKPLILWPEREDLGRTMPECFTATFGDKVAVIIDCFEVFIDRPSNLLARSCTWSSYKHHNTIKLLIGITPQGVVSFISDAWGGRTSDKYLTEHCGFLKKLLPGDVVLADRGFDVSESIGMCQAKLHLPAFTKGKKQLSALEVEETRTIANVRIHVERVIGNVRQKFSILQGTLPIDYVIRRAGEDCPLIDRITRVCCALCNVCNSVIPFD